MCAGRIFTSRDGTESAMANILLKDQPESDERQGRLMNSDVRDLTHHLRQSACRNHCRHRAAHFFDDPLDQAVDLTGEPVHRA